VGAGIAGLGAAWRLARKGFAVRVVDRADRVGGRVAAELDDGTVLEAVPQVLCAQDRRLLAWIGAVGLRDELLPLRPLVTSVSCEGVLRDVEVARFTDVRRIPGVRWWEALRLVRLPRLLSRYRSALDPAAPERAGRFDDRSVADFCRLYFGPSVLEYWLAPRLLADSLGDTRETSRVLVLHELLARGFARLGVPRAPLSEVAQRVAASLPVSLGVDAHTLSKADGGRVRLETTAGALEADAMVIAVPAPEALRIAAPLLRSAEREALGGVTYAKGVTVAALLRRPLRARPTLVRVPPADGSPLACALIEPGLPAGRVAEDRSLLFLRATPEYADAHFDAPSEAIEKDLLAAFERAWPGAQRSVERVRTLRVRHAAPRFEVGRYRVLERWERLQRDARAEGRRVYFAGDYLTHPSFEGALASSERASTAVVEDLA
jgi:predicted NAD/FAD-dependent oxidoreductase